MNGSRDLYAIKSLIDGVVFSIPKMLRGIFRKRRQLLSLLFQSAIDTLPESFRLQLGLAEGKLGAVAAVHTFGDYLVFHPHLHVLVADGLFAPDGRFHCLPQGAIGPMTELFRHLSKRHHNTKRNFEIFKATDFISAALLHLPSKGQQTVRYYGVYSNKDRGRPRETSPTILNTCRNQLDVTHSDPHNEHSEQGMLILVDRPPKRSARIMRPLWRELILQVWGGDPLECPCCHGTMKIMQPMLRREEVEFFLRLYGLWEGVVRLPRPPPPPFDIESLQRIEPPWRAIKEWTPDDEPDLDWFNRSRNPVNPNPDGYDQSQTCQPKEIQLDDCRILVFDYT